MTETKHGKIIYALIALAGVLCAVLSVLKFSLGCDDMAALGMCTHGSFSDMMAAVIAGDRNPPLSHIFFWLWLKIIPKNDFLLVLPTFLALGCGIFLCGLTGERIRGFWGGVIAAAFSAVGSMIMYAFWVRPYGFLFCGAALAAYLYMGGFEKSEVKESIKGQILLGLLFISLVGTHYFGIFPVLACFVFDLVSVLKKRNKPLVFLSYAICAVAFGFWFVFGILIPSAGGVAQISSTGDYKITSRGIAALRSCSCDRHCDFKRFAFIISILGVVMYFACRDLRKYGVILASFVILLYLILTVGAMIMSVPRLLAARYSVVFVPGISLLLVDLLFGIKNRAAAGIIGLLALFCAYSLLNTEVLRSLNKRFPYRAAAAYLMTREDVFDDNVTTTAFWLPFANRVTAEGWQYWYMSEDGKTADVSYYGKPGMYGGKDVVYLFRNPAIEAIYAKKFPGYDMDDFEQEEDARHGVYRCVIEKYVRK